MIYLTMIYSVMTFLYKKIIFAIFLLTFGTCLLASQEGNYFTQNFSYSDYEGNHQVFESIQDNRGIMYFANTEVGVLEYDGNLWKHISLENFSSGRCLAKSDDGTIYVGGVGDFGYLKTDELQSKYISLVSKIPKKQQNFDYVWECEANKDGVYFNTDKTIYFYNGKTIETINTNREFHILRQSNGRVFIRVVGKGLFEIEGKILKPLTGGEIFAKHSANAIIAKENGDLIVFSRDNGIFTYNGKRFIKQVVKSTKEFEKSLIYDAILIEENKYAVATKNGIFIIKNNEVIKHFNMYLGLINNIVLNLYLDKGKNLWITTDGGISKINLHNGLSYFDDRQGINNSINDIKIFNKKLLIATMNGVLVKDESRFKKIQGLDNGVWRLEQLNNTLYIGSTNGLYTYKNNQIIKSNLAQESVVSMCKDDKENLYISQSNHISIMKKTKDGLKVISKIPNLKYRPTFMLYENNHLWFTNEKKNLFSVSLNNGFSQAIKKDFSSFLEGKNRQSFFMRKVGSRVYFSLDNQFYTFNYEKQSFEKTSLFPNLSKDILIKDLISHEDDTWLISGKNLLTSRVVDKNGKKLFQHHPFSYFKGRKIMVIEKDEDNTFWLGGPEGLIHYIPSKASYKDENTILIRSLILDNAKTKAFNNFFYKGGYFFIDVALNSYSLIGMNRYKFELDGVYKKEQGYSTNHKFDINNLPHGDYSLTIYAQDDSKKETTKIINFTVLTPWYFSSIAYFIYSFILLFFIYLSGKIQSYYKNIKQQKELDYEHKQRLMLEEKVKERTKELHVKNKLLEILAITDKLTNLYNRVKLDTVFESELNRAIRYESTFSIILIDIDFFKSVNDVHGHQVGDNVLIEFANILKTSIRDVDVLGRWGGEEFLIICPDTKTKGVISLAEHIRRKIELYSFKVVGNKTASLGVSSFMKEDTEEIMIQRADDGLYFAKQNGRNQVVYR